MSERNRITVVVINDVATVRFNDSRIVDNANIEELGGELVSIVKEDKIKHILLIFEGVDFLSSAALNKFIHLDKAVKQAGGNLRLCSLKQEIKEIFVMTRLDRVFDIRNSESDGLKSFGLE
ncbi:MAG: STAS domain-containing protein [Aureliella sp.]